MEYNRPVFSASGILLILMLILAVSCSPYQPLPTPTSTPPPTPTFPNTELTPTIDTDGLPPEVADTLLSIEQVDKYPLYVMHYAGSYNSLPIGIENPATIDFGCSLFAALGNEGNRLYGRNFDWQYSPALLLYTAPPDGYVSVSMVNLMWLQMDWKLIAALAKAPLAARTPVLSAPTLPIDGMNEYGLTIGMALVTDGAIDDPPYDPERPTMSPLGMIREMLDHARDVDEAVETFKQYNIDFSGAVPIHYLLADPSGKSVLLEFHDQKLVQLPNLYPWHMATNHLRCIANGNGGCWRYQILFNRLVGKKGKLDPAAAMQLLADVKQDSTQWSVVYHMNTGDVEVVLGANYDTVHTFHLELVKP
ncbi:MAG TPA: linear amide C-N hydrolase [Anaerolineales bacterium]|nr:linear amide C-N hydrolase [Anaerolineales bacterium]